MGLAIKAEGISKRYALGGRRGPSYSTLRETVAGAFRRGLGLEPRPPAEGDFYALRDVSFEVKPGDRLGIIGRNGAGKSTLLKVLSRITEPTAGRVSLKGRVSSLLEVGTGFHPELTGRENIYLNGAILGMKRSEIKRKFDEIVAFAEVEKFLDTPVKRYSSGMYVRLAFSVAAHLEPEILVVDEVLAVGDANFQKKCMTRMETAGREGRTILFVTHNMTAVKNLCNRGLLLDNGEVKYSGRIEDCAAAYLSGLSASTAENMQWEFGAAPGTERIKVRRAWCEHSGNLLTVNTPVQICTEFWNLHDGFPVNVSMHLFDAAGGLVFNISTDNRPLKRGLHRAVFHVPGQLLNDGWYSIQNYFVSAANVHFIHQANSFEVHEDRETAGWHGKWGGAVRPTFIKNDYVCLEEGVK